MLQGQAPAHRRLRGRRVPRAQGRRGRRLAAPRPLRRRRRAPPRRAWRAASPRRCAQRARRRARAVPRRRARRPPVAATGPRPSETHAAGSGCRAAEPVERAARTCRGSRCASSSWPRSRTSTHREGERGSATRARFLRWRPDRDPASCTYDQLDEPVAGRAPRDLRRLTPRPRSLGVVRRRSSRSRLRGRSLGISIGRFGPFPSAGDPVYWRVRKVLDGRPRSADGNVGASPRFFLPWAQTLLDGQEEVARWHSSRHAIAPSWSPPSRELGLELYDVEVSGSGRARILRVLVDREGGVDLEAITDATQALSPLLDAPPRRRRAPGPYALEVSSPGLERPLRTPGALPPRRRRHRLGEDREPTAPSTRPRRPRRRRRRRHRARARRRQRRARRVRRHRAGAHGVRVGPASRSREVRERRAREATSEQRENR